MNQSVNESCNFEAMDTAEETPEQKVSLKKYRSCERYQSPKKFMITPKANNQDVSMLCTFMTNKQNFSTSQRIGAKT